MRVLFDQGTPVPLRRHLHPHVIDTAHEKGWSMLRNGELLREAEASGYEALITTDTNLRYQQNLTARQIAILVLMSTSWPRMREKASDVKAALDGLSPGSFVELDF